MAETSSFFSSRRDAGSPSEASPAVARECQRRRSGSSGSTLQRPLEKRRCVREMAAATCGICLEAMDEQGLLLGRLNTGVLTQSCVHGYCFTCIMTWANRTNTCPMCKERFNAVRRVRGQGLRRGGEIVPVENRDPTADVNSEDENLAAELQGDEEENESELGEVDDDGTRGIHGYVMDDFLVSDGEEGIEWVTENESEGEWQKWGPLTQRRSQRSRTASAGSSAFRSGQPAPSASRPLREYENWSDGEEEVVILSSVRSFGRGWRAGGDQESALDRGRGAARGRRARGRMALRSEDAHEVEDDVLPDELRQLQREAARVVGDSPLRPRRRPPSRARLPIAVSDGTRTAVSRRPGSSTNYLPRSSSPSSERENRSRLLRRANNTSPSSRIDLAGSNAQEKDSLHTVRELRQSALQSRPRRRRRSGRSEEAIVGGAARWGPWISPHGVAEESKTYTETASRQRVLAELSVDGEHNVLPSSSTHAVAGAPCRTQNRSTARGSGAGGNAVLSSLCGRSSVASVAGGALCPCDRGGPLKSCETEQRSSSSLGSHGLQSGSFAGLGAGVSPWPRRGARLTGGGRGGDRSSRKCSEDSDAEMEWMAESPSIRLAVEKPATRGGVGDQSGSTLGNRDRYSDICQRSSEEASQDGAREESAIGDDEEVEFDWQSGEHKSAMSTSVGSMRNGFDQDQDRDDSDGEALAVSPPSPPPVPLRTRLLQRRKLEHKYVAGGRPVATLRGQTRASSSGRKHSSAAQRNESCERKDSHLSEASGGDINECTLNSESDEDSAFSTIGEEKSRAGLDWLSGTDGAHPPARRSLARKGRGSSGVCLGDSRSTIRSESSSVAISQSALAKRLLDKFRFNGPAP